MAYRLMNATSVESLHGPFRGTGVIILNEAVVEALSLDVKTGQSSDSQLHVVWRASSTYILVRDNLDVLDVTSRLKDLSQNILRHTLIEATDVERPLVRFGSRSTKAGSRGENTASILRGPGRGDGGRDRIVVLRNVQRRRGNGLAVLPAIEACGTRIWLRGQLARVGRGSSVSHG